MAIFQPRIDAEAAVFFFDEDLNSIEHNLSMSPVPPVPGSSLIYDYDNDTIIRLTAPEIETEDSTPRNKLIVFTVYWDQEEPYTHGSGFGHLAVAVPNIYRVCEQMEKEGVSIPRPPGPMKHGTTVIAFIEDPDGYKIELIERS